MDLQWFLCPSLATKHSISHYNAWNLKKQNKTKKKNRAGVTTVKLLATCALKKEKKGKGEKRVVSILGSTQSNRLQSVTGFKEEIVKGNCNDTHSSLR